MSEEATVDSDVSDRKALLVVSLMLLGASALAVLAGVLFVVAQNIA